jgi:hypothetical protein
MKRFTFLITIIIVAIVLTITSCDSKREPGKIYMPDMAYTRAVKTFALLDSSLFTDDPNDAGHKIFYNRKPVDSTIKRAELFPFLPKPPSMDSSGYKLSASVKNPLPPLNSIDSAEASRLFNVNCAVCHGADGKASGPIAKGGKLGGIKDLTSDEIVKLADGTIFYSVTYGKDNMGSYASQLDRKQRWMIVQYVRTLQAKPATSSGAADDSMVTKK